MPEELYAIETILSRTTLDAAGRLTKIYEVHFVTRSGVRDTVEIPAKEYSEKRVHDELTKISEIHEAAMKSSPKKG